MCSTAEETGAIVIYSVTVAWKYLADFQQQHVASDGGSQADHSWKHLYCTGQYDMNNIELFNIYNTLKSEKGSYSAHFLILFESFSNQYMSAVAEHLNAFACSRMLFQV